jgi:hypothetical protein
MYSVNEMAKFFQNAFNSFLFRACWLIQPPSNTLVPSRLKRGAWSTGKVDRQKSHAARQNCLTGHFALLLSRMSDLEPFYRHKRPIMRKLVWFIAAGIACLFISAPYVLDAGAERPPQALSAAL